jgi:hypothetical protein
MPTDRPDEQSDVAPSDRPEAQPEVAAGDAGLTAQDARYAQQIAEHSHWPIGDTMSGTGTLRPTDDVGSGGTADVAGPRDFGDTSSIRTGHIGIGGIPGGRLGDTGPQTGAAGPSPAERGGLDALAEQSSSADLERTPADSTRRERAEGRVDLEAGGGLNAAAVQASGMTATDAAGERAQGTDDLGAAAGPDLGAGLGQTRGQARQNPRGQITGAGGTRGSGAGTGHLEDSPG